MLSKTRKVCLIANEVETIINDLRERAVSIRSKAMEEGIDEAHIRGRIYDMVAEKLNDRVLDCIQEYLDEEF